MRCTCITMHLKGPDSLLPVVSSARYYNKKLCGGLRTIDFQTLAAQSDQMMSQMTASRSSSVFVVGNTSQDRVYSTVVQ
jgi:hypothetical protein